MKAIYHLCLGIFHIVVLLLFNTTTSAQDCPTAYADNSGSILFTWGSGTKPTGITSVRWTDASDYAGSDVSATTWQTTSTAINPTGTETGTIIFTYSGGTYHCAITAGALPIELMYFKGSRVDNTTVLEWATASEIDNSHFTLEKSTDNINWTVVTVIKGAGNSVNINKYKHIDSKPLSKIVYYRLRQDDYNGDYTYANTIAVNSKDNTQLELKSIYPETNTVKVTLDGYNKEEPLTIHIYNQLGNVVKTVNINPYEVTNEELNLDIADLATGLYTIRILNGNQQTTAKFIR